MLPSGPKVESPRQCAVLPCCPPLRRFEPDVEPFSSRLLSVNSRIVVPGAASNTARSAVLTAIQFRTLGTLDLRTFDGRELHSLLAQPKRVGLLAYLCVATPRGFHRRDKLLGIFWPNADQGHARTSLRNSVHVLRRSLGENAVVSRGDEEIA